MQSRVYSVEEVKVEGLITIPENPPAISISAKGWVATSGWTAPSLSPWMYIAPPKDGILDLDFVATAPTGIVLQVFTRIATIVAMPVPRWVIGVRVHTSTNRLEKLIEGATTPAAADLMGEGLPLPWPFPWWAPRTKQI